MTNDARPQDDASGRLVRPREEQGQCLMSHDTQSKDEGCGVEGNSSSQSQPCGAEKEPLPPVAEPSAVWRVCHALRGECKRCPATVLIEGHGECVRGCYAVADELVNIVETGNPWRKTSDVREPWTSFAKPERPS